MSTIITAILIWVAETPLVPAPRGGQPGPTGPLPPPAPGAAARADCVPAALPPPPAAEPAVPAGDPCAPGAALAPLVSAVWLAEAPEPLLSAARLVEPRSAPGTRSHTRRARTTTVASPAATRSAVGARRAQKRNSWLGLIRWRH